MWNEVFEVVEDDLGGNPCDMSGCDGVGGEDAVASEVGFSDSVLTVEPSPESSLVQDLRCFQQLCFGMILICKFAACWVQEPA